MMSNAARQNIGTFYIIITNSEQKNLSDDILAYSYVYRLYQPGKEPLQGVVSTEKHDIVTKLISLFE